VAVERSEFKGAVSVGTCCGRAVVGRFPYLRHHGRTLLRDLLADVEPVTGELPA